MSTCLPPLERAARALAETGLLLTDDECRWIAGKVIAAIKYEDGTDESRLIEVSSTYRVEAVSLSEAYDAMLDSIIAEQDAVDLFQGVAKSRRDG